MSFKIEKNVPMNAFPSAKYPFAGMDVGDSFRIEVADRQRVVSAASMYAGRSKSEMKFSIRKHEDAYRCWRVK